MIALTALDLPEPLASSYATADHRLAVAVATYVAARLRHPKLKTIHNPVGFLRRLLDLPEKCGFTRLPGGDWLAPTSREARAAALSSRPPNETHRRAELWKQASEEQKAEARRRVLAAGVSRDDRGTFVTSCLLELERMSDQAVPNPERPNE